MYYRRSSLLLVLSIVIVTGAARAIDVSVPSPSPQFLEIARNSDGTPLELSNQFDAFQYCAAQGNHLPSAREMTLLAKTLGAQGIVIKPADGDVYTLLYEVISYEGNFDSFYYNSRGYKQPDPASRGDFWTSSNNRDLNPRKKAMIFVGESGDISEPSGCYRENGSAWFCPPTNFNVRCIFGPPQE